ncbi:proline iminopeptidase [Thalassotalea insulae]|uniref:Proline iminopeptidase n=1 Tax=Thalassotalea insulae TaxID=2056778 RepID=A0ABQ6GWK2_9GAMM|nr:prolyl aminopeptidase [Thalassotalea insulae]GLX78546.1 proline iminopeptidase [Thalassotalea insulae]
MQQLFPEIEPYQSELLAVDATHQLYVEQCGNPQGQPVLFIHGGPGAGCSTKDRRFFDPEKYRIVLFDQRGCGRSKPFGSLTDNETSFLVADIEKIRHHLSIESWHVFGGSWGSTLALVYAQSHPQSVLSLVLRGIFLGRPQDTQWTFEGGGGTRIFADYWHEYLACFPDGESQQSIKAAYDIMTGDDKALAKKIANAWANWEIRCCTLEPNEEFLAGATDDDSSWTLSRHEAHFMVHDCFLTDNQILANCEKITEIPMIIVHGRYDIVCPFDNAWLLHQALPKSQLVISKTAGHASIEPETTHHLINATNKMLTL